jgi:hypothetical protein
MDQTRRGCVSECRKGCALKSQEGAKSAPKVARQKLRVKSCAPKVARQKLRAKSCAPKPGEGLCIKSVHQICLV